MGIEECLLGFVLGRIGDMGRFLFGHIEMGWEQNSILWGLCDVGRIWGICVVLARVRVLGIMTCVVKIDDKQGKK